jgi:hypothetical protein
MHDGGWGGEVSFHSCVTVRRSISSASETVEYITSVRTYVSSVFQEVVCVS